MIYLDVSNIVQAMQNYTAITDLVDADNIFDGLPDEAPNENYIYLEWAISQINRLTVKSNRLAIRIMSWEKWNNSTYPVLREIYRVINGFLAWADKKFWDTSVYIVVETNYIETLDEAWKNMIINEYFFNFVK